MPVRIGEPQNIKGIIDEIQDTPYAAVVGLAIYGAMSGTTSASNFKMNIPGMPSFKGSGKISKKIIDLVKSFIP